jgi:hypothetical protein
MRGVSVQDFPPIPPTPYSELGLPRPRPWPRPHAPPPRILSSTEATAWATARAMASALASACASQGQLVQLEKASDVACRVACRAASLGQAPLTHYAAGWGPCTELIPEPPCWSKCWSKSYPQQRSIRTGQGLPGTVWHKWLASRQRSRAARSPACSQECRSIGFSSGQPSKAKQRIDACRPLGSGRMPSWHAVRALA